MKSTHEIAGHLGSEGENIIVSFFKAAGFRSLPDEKSLVHSRKKFCPDNPQSNVEFLKNIGGGSPVFITQVIVCRSIYGHPWKADIFAYCPVRFPNGLIVESKRQTTSGSVDEKLPFVVLSMNQADQYNCLLSILGGGMRPVATDWAKKYSARHVSVALSESDVRKYIKDPRAKKEQTLGHTDPQTRLI